ncbi:ribonuclease E/G [Rhizobiales bacterium]|uniref:Rne/Rng family ribonuclease n=1 Tax=Hongsoonwoonella zoysiae TaxID=2821844 RepID=UPI00155FD6E0|nr:ribonuclease E/G [Hongsoonwoonella zoysiae]NRG18645.1 ribonuclease E/G [Hongsoonwoonella zoysiae]
MANKMLIDAAHPEETRVVVVRGNRVEEFDFEAASRKQLRGNIYLARVTRVEPSLQAAFVEYGGNRHGFLAFSEIHPDYYQIPVADRQALLEEEDAEQRGAEENGEEANEKPRRAKASDANGGDANGADDDVDEDEVESVGAEDAMEEVPQRAPKARKQYKIQEVIKRRQVLLVQVVKEERGNKGAALTTYLSLAGRYSVLMPNTGRGGGISRKITNPTDRKRLKKIASELEVPEGMGVILRTAGASRTKAEIKRDFEYLLRLWENVRDLTLQSSAPCLVYEEGSLIKRSIRDLYNKDIDQVLVAGDEGYREAKDFMRMLMPSHARNVQPYREPTPVFTRFGVEAQLDAMFSPQVTLKSGGYIVINQTEALVSIDVNSGKSTREHNIEDTALQTNLEAAEEIARQLRLRDLAGLIVIDFIDMEENKNNRSVERRMKECLKNDRARIQVGRISHFGLLEMSRQRLRTGVLESSTTVCPHCHGSGMIRSVESVALHVLRSLEDQLLKGVTHNIIVRTPGEVALYILNQKRSHLTDLEARFSLEISVLADTMVNGQHYVLERGELLDRDAVAAAPAIVQPDTILPVAETIEEPPETEDSDGGEEEGGRGKRRRRRRRRKPGQGDGEALSTEAEAGASNDNQEQDAEAESAAPETDDDQREEDRKRKRRRGRRGGRRGRKGDGANQDADSAEAETSADAAFDDTQAPDREAESVEFEPSQGEDARTADISTDAPAPAGEPIEASDTAEDGEDETGVEQPAEEPAAIAATVDVAEISSPPPAEPPASEEVTAPEPVVVSEKPDGTTVEPEKEEKKPKRSGWWQRRGFF